MGSPVHSLLSLAFQTLQPQTDHFILTLIAHVIFADLVRRLTLCHGSAMTQERMGASSLCPSIQTIVMRGRSSSPGPLLKHGRGRDDPEGGDDGERGSRHRHRSQSRERSGHRHHRHRHRSRSHSPIGAVQHRGRSRSSSPTRRRGDSHSPRGHSQETPAFSFCIDLVFM